jgi:phenylpyruvate tautomerase PptA (4-oxalocrotonate tautomerase family)
MPVAKVYVPEGTLTQDQRREIVKASTMSSLRSERCQLIRRHTC